MTWTDKEYELWFEIYSKVFSAGGLTKENYDCVPKLFVYYA